MVARMVELLVASKVANLAGELVVSMVEYWAALSVALSAE
jgi:hypothetical protein